MTTTGLPSIAKIAELLGGEVRGNQVYAPGPGHSAGDRSLSVLLDASAPDGFVVNSFAGDDAIVCRDYVRDRLGLAAVRGEEESQRQGEWLVAATCRIRLPRRTRRALSSRQETPRRCRQEAIPAISLGRHAVAKGKPAGPKIPYRLPELLAAPTAVV